MHEDSLPIRVMRIHAHVGERESLSPTTLSRERALRHVLDALTANRFSRFVLPLPCGVHPGRRSPAVFAKQKHRRRTRVRHGSHAAPPQRCCIFGDPGWLAPPTIKKAPFFMELFCPFFIGGGWTHSELLTGRACRFHLHF